MWPITRGLQRANVGFARREFGILGPLTVRSDAGATVLGGSRPRALLAMLLLHPNESVSAERLAVALLGEDAPRGAVKTVRVHVSRLRRALGDPNVLTTTTDGYRPVSYTHLTLPTTPYV